MQKFNVYCDESRHLENDKQQVMVLGAISCPQGLSRSISKRIKAIKAKHHISPSFEIKWTKVSPAKIDFYLDLVSFFFEESELNFRAIVIPDKNMLRHDLFNQDHDTWYYKMYFELLKVLLAPHDSYCIYLDKKDTKSGEKVTKLHDILCNNSYDFQRQIIEKVQHVHSSEVEQIQLTDLLIGCVGGANNPNGTSAAKNMLIEKMRRLSGYCLTRTTLIKEKKVNLLVWQSKNG